MSWDPDQYLRFADHRRRPGIELLSRIPDIDARSIVDLGCGTGDLTALLQVRWPAAAVVGIDSSVEMIERARDDHPHMAWSIAGIEAWEPSEPVDLIFSNAALHWLDDHRDLFRKLRSSLADGGVLAVQMPDNWRAPTHRIPADLLDERGWPDEARAALLRDRLATPDAYAEWLQPANVDVWRTTYFQQLAGDDPVWTWVTGSVLRPVLSILASADRERFSEACRLRYREVYPRAANGSVTVPFSRLFIVARAT
ncbi:MAG: methyltransferase domain-containing protein [Acidimicrobiia bacterium]